MYMKLTCFLWVPVCNRIGETLSPIRAPGVRQLLLTFSFGRPCAIE